MEFMYVNYPCTVIVACGSLCKECLLSAGQELFPKERCFLGRQGGHRSPQGRARGPRPSALTLLAAGLRGGPERPPGKTQMW